MCVCVLRIVKTKVTTRIITTAKNATIERRRRYKRKSKRKCARWQVQARRRATKMKWKRELNCRRRRSVVSVSVSALALASTLASSSLATLARDMCVAFNKLQLQLQPRLPAYFYPLAKIFEWFSFLAFFFGFFDRISSYLAEVKQNNNKTRALFCTHTSKQGSTQTVRWGRGSVHYGKRCFLNILYISHYSPYNCKWRWLLLYCVCVTVTVGNYLCLVFCFQLFIFYLRNGTRVRQGEEKCNNHMKQSQTFALEEHALSRLHHI